MFQTYRKLREAKISYCVEIATFLLFTFAISKGIVIKIR